MTDDPLARRSDGALALCTHCGKTCPAHASTCPWCGAGFDANATVRDDVHHAETVVLDTRGREETTPDGRVISRKTPPNAFASEPPTVDRRGDEERGHPTAVVQRRPIVPDPAPSVGSSSDPPTRFLRRFDQHVDLPSGSVVDDYEIDEQLGAGAMGVVYRARHVKLGRTVALKVIAPDMGDDPQALARFEREARTLASLRHPNIVDVHAFGTLPDGRHYFIMEHLAGETLDDRLARGRASLGEALDVLDQMARGLKIAHAQGIVHRDLKPSNTFLLHISRDQRPVVKLLDWGLVKSPTADGVERTASGAVIGTALYLSPEQARGPNVDGRTDVYALGCIAYELVLGRHPFPEARTPTAALAAHLTEPPPQPRSIWPGIPAALDLLLYSMLAKDPSYRPTLGQVRSVIAGVGSPVTSQRAPRHATTAPVRTLSVRRWTAAVGAIVLFVVGIAIGARCSGTSSTSSAHESSVQD